MQNYRPGAGGVCGRAKSDFSVNEERDTLAGPVPAERQDERLVIPGVDRRELVEDCVDHCRFVPAAPLRDS